MAKANKMTKDHAARMRFHRLRKDMEGVDFQPRKRKAATDAKEPPKKKPTKGKKFVEDDVTDDEEPLISKRRKISLLREEDERLGLKTGKEDSFQDNRIKEFKEEKVKLEELPEMFVKMEEAEDNEDVGEPFIKAELVEL